MSASVTISRPMHAVPREFYGQARVWQTALEIQDAEAVAKCVAIAASVRAPLTKGSLPKKELIEEAARAWTEDIPALGRLRLNIEQRNRRLIVTDLRVGAARQGLIEWADMEDSVVIFLSGFRLVRWNFEFVECTVASISLHALARRFQRGIDNSDAAVRADMVALAAANPMLSEDGRFDVPVPNGSWAGYMQTTGHDTYLAARTFR